jgi:lipopolysaccharide transport system permease protein
MTGAAEELVLEAGRAERHYWRDLWRYRELLYILAWRDIAVRYKQTAIGVAWALLQPLAQMVVMVLIFSKIAQLPSEGGAPYALLVFAAMLPWQFFASSISSASMSIVSPSEPKVSSVSLPSAGGVTCHQSERVGTHVPQSPPLGSVGS